MPPKEVAIHHTGNDMRSPISDQDSGIFMNGDQFPIADNPHAMEKIEEKPSIGIYQIIIDRKTQDIMTIREFIKKEFFRKVSGRMGIEY